VKLFFRVRHTHKLELAKRDGLDGLRSGLVDHQTPDALLSPSDGSP